jgi:hypothetical protein
MDYFEKSAAMISAQVDAVPLKLWNWGVRNISGALRSFPEEQVHFAVMPTAKGSVTERGIRFRGLFYTCDKAIAELWFEKARAKRSWQVDVLYDPRDMTSIYVRNQDDNGYEICSLLDWNSKNAGKCYDEIIYEQRKESVMGRELKTAETEAKVNLNAEIEAIVAAAQDMTDGLKSKSKYEQVSQIKENRRVERDIMRTANKQSDAGEPKPAIQASSNPGDDMSPRLRMIKAKVEERLKND